MDGHHCQLFNLFDQWILRIGRRLAIEGGLWYELTKPMHSCKGFQFCAFSCGFVIAHQTEDLALKSPKVIVNKALLVVVSLKII